MTHFMAHGTYNMHIIILYHCITRVSSPFPKDVLCSIILYSHSIITSVDYILQNYQWILSKPARRRASPFICPGFISALTLDQLFVQILLARKIRSEFVFKQVPCSKPTWQRKISLFKRRYIFKHGCFSVVMFVFKLVYIYVSVTGSIPLQKKKRGKNEKNTTVSLKLEPASIQSIIYQCFRCLFYLSIKVPKKNKSSYIHP